MRNVALPLVLALGVVVGRPAAAADDVAARAPAPKCEEKPAPKGDPPAPEALRELRPGEVLFRPAAGRDVWFRLRTTFAAEQSVPIRRFPDGGELTSDLRLTFGAADDEGTVPVSVHVARTVGWWAGPDRPRRAIDSWLAPIPRDLVDELAGPFLPPASFHVRRDGRIVEIEDRLRAQSAASVRSRREAVRRRADEAWLGALDVLPFAGVWPVLPQQRMGAGAYFHSASLPPWPISPSYRLDLRHEVRRIDERRVVFATSGGVDDLDPARQAGVSQVKDGAPRGPRVRSSGFAQSSEVDRADGLVRKSSTRFTLVRHESYGFERNFHDGTSSFTFEAVLERIDAPPEEAAAPDAPAPAPGPSAGAPAGSGAKPSAPRK